MHQRKTKHFIAKLCPQPFTLLHTFSILVHLSRSLNKWTISRINHCNWKGSPWSSQEVIDKRLASNFPKSRLFSTQEKPLKILFCSKSVLKCKDFVWKTLAARQIPWRDYRFLDLGEPIFRQQRTHFCIGRIKWACHQENTIYKTFEHYARFWL